MTDDTTRPDRPSGWAIPLGVGAGSGIGLFLGILLDALVMGMVVGAATGLIVGAVTTSAADTPAAQRGRVIASTIAIVLAGAAIILAMLSR